MSKNVSAKKPYCKVCFDAGKSEKEYTSHWVKDRDGKTLCPTLLSTECRYCFKLGHTAKFCDVLAKNNKEKEKADRRTEASVKEKPKKPVAPKTQTNLFSALCEESDSEEEKVEVSKTNIIVEEFPILGAISKKVAVTLPKVEPEVKTGWAAIAAKPKEDKFMKDIEERSILKMLPQSALRPAPAPKPAPWVSQSRDYTKDIYTKSWADWSDSDSDTEIDEKIVPDKSSYVQAVDDDDW